MSANAVVRARIDGKIKAEAAEALAELGLTVSDAVRLMLRRVARDKVLPFEPFHPMDDFQPGPITIAAMQEARAGGLKSYSSFKDFLAEIDAEG